MRLKRLCTQTRLHRGDAFVSYRTSAYKLHYFETLTGLKFIMNTDPSVSSMRDHLRFIYSEYYVAYVAKNPLCKLEDKIDSELFVKGVDRYVRSLPVFGGA